MTASEKKSLSITHSGIKNFSLVYGPSLCNGLILSKLYLEGVDNGDVKFMGLFLWNPFTRRRYKIILNCPVHADYCRATSSIGLGFDSAHDDYKVVIISELINDGSHCFPVRVFSLKSNSWKRIQDAPILFNVDTFNTGDLRSSTAKFANDALYWLRDFEILGFDLANEMFFSIELPGYSASPRSYRGLVVVIDGSLYIAKILDDGRTQQYYLRVGDDEGTAGAVGFWTEAFEVDEGYRVFFNYGFSWPLTYSKAGGSILLSQLREAKANVFGITLKRKQEREQRLMATIFARKLCFLSAMIVHLMGKPGRFRSSLF